MGSIVALDVTVADQGGNWGQREMDCGGHALFVVGMHRRRLDNRWVKAKREAPAQEGDYDEGSLQLFLPRWLKTVVC